MKNMLKIGLLALVMPVALSACHFDKKTDDKVIDTGSAKIDTGKKIDTLAKVEDTVSKDSIAKPATKAAATPTK